MFPPVLKYLNQRVAHLAGRAQRSRVISIRPHPTAVAEDAVHTLCDPDGKALETAREGTSVYRFDDEMDVVILNRKLDETQPVARRLRETRVQRTEDGVGAQ